LIAQNAFPEEHEDFLKKFTKSFENVKLNDRNGKQLSEEFESFWNSDTLGVEDKDNYIKNYNADLLVQSQKTILSLKIVSIIVPLIIYIIATIVMSRLNLDEFGDQMHKELNERKISKFIK
jgi:hypothetical protein